MSYVLLTYALYSVAAIGLTVALARTLYRNGAVFLQGLFDDRPEMADAINNLLVTGFYMLNLGYAFLIFRTDNAETALGATENLVTKLGLLLVSLGVIHFGNMLVVWKIRDRAERKNTYPVPPAASIQPPPPGAEDDRWTGALAGQR